MIVMHRLSFDRTEGILTKFEANRKLPIRKAFNSILFPHRNLCVYLLKFIFNILSTQRLDKF